MAGADRTAFSDIENETEKIVNTGLESDLLREGASFSFFQAMRLLRIFGRSIHQSGDGQTLKKGEVNVRPKLTLAFPPADVDSIKKRSDKDRFLYQITVNFLGLYGVSSPIPTFYTEDFLDEASEDSSISRDFTDIFNQRIYQLFFSCLKKYRQSIQVVEEGSELQIQQLFSLVGLGEAKLREGINNSDFLLRHIGLFSQLPRSASGLKTMLKDALGAPPVEVIPCVKRFVKIPEDQRICLGVNGGYLGRDSFLGEEIEDRNGKFRLRIGPMDITDFQCCFPGGDAYKKIVLLTRLYVTDPFEYDIELLLKKGQKKTVCLGASEWSWLGMNTWIFSGDDRWESRSIVYPDN